MESSPVMTKVTMRSRVQISFQSTLSINNPCSQVQPSGVFSGNSGFLPFRQHPPRGAKLTRSRSTFLLNKSNDLTFLRRLSTATKTARCLRV